MHKSLPVSCHQATTALGVSKIVTSNAANSYQQVANKSPAANKREGTRDSLCATLATTLQPKMSLKPKRLSTVVLHQSAGKIMAKDCSASKQGEQHNSVKLLRTRDNVT